MPLIRTVAFVTGVALLGMLLGAAFGWAAATIAPSFFRNVAAGEVIEPVGFATVLGAFGGVICGGALGAFTLLLDALATRRSHGNPPHHSPDRAADAGPADGRKPDRPPLPGK